MLKEGCEDPPPKPDENDGAPPVPKPDEVELEPPKGADVDAEGWPNPVPKPADDGVGCAGVDGNAGKAGVEVVEGVVDEPPKGNAPVELEG